MLIATDGSDNGIQAVKAVMEIAWLNHGKAYALHVIDVSGYPSGRGDPKWTRLIEEQFKTFGLEMTTTVEETAKAAGVEVEFVTLEGHPAEKILDFAEKQAVDMIVVGSLGKNDAERFLLGSISEKVVRNAKVSVLVVHGKNSETNRRPFDCGAFGRKVKNIDVNSWTGCCLIAGFFGGKSPEHG